MSDNNFRQTVLLLSSPPIIEITDERGQHEQNSIFFGLHNTSKPISGENSIYVVCKLFPREIYNTIQVGGICLFSEISQMYPLNITFHKDFKNRSCSSGAPGFDKQVLIAYYRHFKQLQ